MASAEAMFRSAEILVAPTWECNLQCTYCFVRHNNVMQQEERMTPKLAAQVIDALDCGLTYVESICVHLYGGEPFINISAARAMVERAKEKAVGRFTFAVTTNGTILSDDVLDLLEAGNFSIVLSIDGPAEIHDTCRRTVNNSPTHARVMEFLAAVRTKTSCRVCASSVVRAGWSLKQATDYSRTLPVDGIKAQAIRVSATTLYALNDEEIKAYGRDLEVIGDKVINDLENNRVPMDNRFASRVLQLLKNGERRAFCGAGRTTFGITPSGYVLPCILIEGREAVLGHINDNPRSWTEAGRKWRQKTQRRECSDCDYLYMCGGGCPAMVPVCGEEECIMVRKNCEVAISIFKHFKDKPESLLGLAGIV